MKDAPPSSLSLFIQKGCPKIALVLTLSKMVIESLAGYLVRNKRYYSYYTPHHTPLPQQLQLTQQLIIDKRLGCTTIKKSLQQSPLIQQAPHLLPELKAALELIITRHILNLYSEKKGEETLKLMRTVLAMLIQSNSFSGSPNDSNQATFTLTSQPNQPSAQRTGTVLEIQQDNRLFDLLYTYLAINRHIHTHCSEMLLIENHRSKKIIQLQTQNNEFESIYTTSGNVSNRQESSPDIIGFIDIEFKDWDKRRKADVLISEIREATSSIPGIKVETRTQRAGPPRGKPIEINLTSNDPVITISEVKRIQEYLSNIQGLKDLETSLPSPSIEYQLYVNREEAAKYGASIAIIGNTIKLITGGLKLSEFRPDDSDESIPIYLRLPENQRTIDQLNSIKIPTSSGYVPISNFTEIETSQETGNLVRVDQNRIETIKSDVVRFYQTDAYVRLIKHWLGIQKFDIPNNFGLDLPEFNSADIDPRVKVSFKGEDESQKQSQAFLQKAFMIAIFLMGVILLTQFNSFSSAILILFAVIMSTVGVVLGLLITQQPFGIVMSGIGVISLAGIVVNNNIVLIDTFDRLYKKTKDAKEALLMTGAQRLRPVLLTTTTTVLGLMPMALKINIDFVNLEYTYNSPDTQWWVDLSRAIIFGLLFSTLLTLLVTPSALMIKSKFLSGGSAEKSKKVKKQVKYS